MNTQEIEALVEKIEEHADGIFGMDLNRLNIRHDLKGTCAGECTSNTEYRFNKHIAENNEGYEQTVYHEVAHQIAVQLYGRIGSGHGKYWKHVMRELGRPANRCHNYNEVKSARTTKRYSYTCECGKIMELSSVRYNKQMRGRVVYGCTTCSRSIEMGRATRIR